MKKTFTIKQDCCLDDIMFLQVETLIIYTSLLMFARQRNLPVKITSVFSDRLNVKSKSRTHEDFRAIDISTMGWREKDALDAVTFLNEKHKDIAAISASDLKPRAAIYHNYENQGSHLHLQSRPR